MARQKAAFGVLLGSQEPVGTAMLLPTQLLGRTVEKKKKKKGFHWQQGWREQTSGLTSSCLLSRNAKTEPSSVLLTRKINLHCSPRCLY